jgi:AhpD family alkylhydroperoxidase
MADNIGTAAKGTKAGLHEIQKRLGFIPNPVLGLADAPAALDGYLALDRACNHSSFTAEERQIVLLAASVENSCRYCAAVHTTMLKAMRTAPATIAAIRNRTALQEPKPNALVRSLGTSLWDGALLRKAPSGIFRCRLRRHRPEGTHRRHRSGDDGQLPRPPGSDSDRSGSHN